MSLLKTIIGDKDELYVHAIDLAHHCLNEAKKVKPGTNKKALLELAMRLTEFQEELTKSKKLAIVKN